MKHDRSKPEAWPRPAKPRKQVRLQVDGAGKVAPAHDLSATARKGDTLFLGADEAAAIEVLHRKGRGFVAARRAKLGRAFDLPDGKEELDIEGLAIEGRWLWVVGSHSLTRRTPAKSRRLRAGDVERLPRLKDNDNRMFLGRLPLKKASKRRWKLRLKKAGGRQPQMLPIGGAGSALYRRLKKDPLLGPFCKLPAKENGLDIEGIVVDGRRVGLGLRGPVINGWAMVLELKVRKGGAGLKLKRRFKTHFLHLGGLGIRDLKQEGDDVLILAGPTMALDGPVQVFRWKNWGRAAKATKKKKNLLHRPQRLLDLPYGLGCDHPEALTPMRAGRRKAVLVVCDSPGRRRLTRRGIRADVFALPG